LSEHAPDAAPAAEAKPGTLAWVFVGPHGVRSGWRLGLYVVLVIVLSGLLSVLAAPLAGKSMVAGFAVSLAAAVLAGWFMLAVVDRRPIGALGFAADRAAPRDFGIGFLMGAVLIAAAAGVVAVAGYARWVADAGTPGQLAATLAGALGFFLVAAAAEEALFRGYAFQVLAEGLGPWGATLLLSAAFAAGHLGNPNVSAFGIANIFLAGVMLSVAYLRTRSLWFATAVHAGWNWTMSALLDFPVSGIARNTPMYSVAERGGGAWLTGGTFGPEAGLPATIAIALALAWLLRTRSVGESGKMRRLGPVVDRRLGPDWPR
jgi:membrane protease YdiL (CAAX protease family)